MFKVKYDFDVITTNQENYELDGKVEPFLKVTGDLPAIVDGSKILPEGTHGFAFTGCETFGKATITFPESAVDGDENTRKRNEVRVYYGIRQDC